jgi:hypothetical protein
LVLLTSGVNVLRNARNAASRPTPRCTRREPATRWVASATIFRVRVHAGELESVRRANMPNELKPIISTSTILFAGVALIVLVLPSAMELLDLGDPGAQQHHRSFRNTNAAVSSRLLDGFRSKELLGVLPDSATAIQYEWNTDSNERWLAFSYPPEFEPRVAAACRPDSFGTLPPSPWFGPWESVGPRAGSRIRCGDHALVTFDRRARRAFVYLESI